MMVEMRKMTMMMILIFSFMFHFIQAARRGPTQQAQLTADEKEYEGAFRVYDAVKNGYIDANDAEAFRKTAKGSTLFKAWSTHDIDKAVRGIKNVVKAYPGKHMDLGQFARWMMNGHQDVISTEEVRITMGCNSLSSSVTIKELAETWSITPKDLKIALKKGSEDDHVTLQEFVDYINKRQ
nr:putative salivary protein [Nilaparvata lugens]